MKQTLKRVLTLCLTLSLTFSLVPPALASEALGSDRFGRTDTLAAGATLTANSLWSATYMDLRTEHYVTYTPNESVTPLLRYGDGVSSKETLSTAAERLVEQGYRVVAGVNGGFFNSDGTPVGLVVTDGVVRSVDRWNYTMVGFLPDGAVFLDGGDIKKSAQWIGPGGEQVDITLAALNGSRDNGGYYLYNDDFGTSTGNTLTGVDVVLEPLTAGQKPVMNGSVSLRVVRVTDSTQEGVAADGVIPAGCYVLSANKNCEQEMLDKLRALTPGTEVTVDITGGDPRWTQAVCGFTALYKLVENGAVVSGLEAGAAPRTALGIKADGSVVFYTIDGRQDGYSVGATYTQVAKRLIELGCVTAVALDGGGSTTLGATLPGSTEFTVLNRPSGGSQRAVSNSLFLVTRASASGLPAFCYIKPARDVVLAGARTSVTAALSDQNGWPAPTSGFMTWSAEGGTVEDVGLGGTTFTAGGQAGVFSITANDGSRSGSAPVRVVTELSALTVTRRDTGKSVTSLKVEPGAVVELDAAGTWYNLPVAVDGGVTWTIEGEIGTVDENGLFTAGAKNASGAITASAGGRAVRIETQVDNGDPFTDIQDHWSREYILKLYEMGLTEGVPQPDGTYQFLPDGELTRGEMLTFLSRLAEADYSLYEAVALPFADAASIPDWALPHVKTLYALQVFNGAANGGVLTAQTDVTLSREMVITMLGRLLAEQKEADLSVFTDGDRVSDWAAPYVKTLLADGVLSGGGALEPQSPVTRGEMAMLLVRTAALPRAELTPREGLAFG